MTVKNLINHVDRYLESIECIRKKQLELLRENALNGNKLLQTKIMDNLLALKDMDERCTILKKTLLLLSDSRQHICLKLWRKTRKNTYEALLSPILSIFDNEDITKSLPQLLESINARAFQQKISSLQQKLITENNVSEVTVLMFIFAEIVFFVTAVLLGVFMPSPILFICALVSLGVYMIHPLIIMINSAVGNPIFEGSSPSDFKIKVIEQFSSLEKKFKTMLQQEYSEHKFEIACSVNGIPITANFEHVQSTSKLRDIFKSNLMFLSSGNNNPTLKEAVDQEYQSLVHRT